MFSLSIPVIVVLIVVLGCNFASLLALLLIFFSDFVPCEDASANQPSFKISDCKAVWCPPQSFKANDTVSTNAINESNDTREHLHAQSCDQKWAVVDVDLQDPSLIVRRGK